MSRHQERAGFGLGRAQPLTPGLALHRKPCLALNGRRPFLGAPIDGQTRKNPTAVCLYLPELQLRV